MRTLLLGTDFMYNSNGNLVPIEINTNVGMDRFTLESDQEIFNLDNLKSFIMLHNFNKITYIGAMLNLSTKLKTLCAEINISYQSFHIGGNKRVPNVEDSNDHLIIRSAYDSSAIVDEEYCRVKPNFLNLIKNKSFFSQFAYIDDDDVFVNNIISIENNGNHPNFILKSVLPYYSEEYPKLFKVDNKEELDIILKNVTKEYHLMQFHYNPSKFKFDHIQVIRSLNLLFPPELKSISIGQYTKLSGQKCNEFSTFDPITFEVSSIDRNKYLSSGGGVNAPKLLDSDLVEMVDGTFKSAEDLLIGDLLKTIDIPNINESNNIQIIAGDYELDYETFISGTTCSTNRVIGKYRVDKLVDYVTMTFTDGKTWEDTISSRYLIVRDNIVKFVYLDLNDPISGIKIGDKLILIYSCDTEMVSILKEIVSVETTRQFFGGWEITVENAHLFLTKAEDSDSSYVAVEHNTNCVSLDCTTDLCIKPQVCCPNGFCSIYIKCSGCP